MCPVADAVAAGQGPQRIEECVDNNESADADTQSDQGAGDRCCAFAEFFRRTAAQENLQSSDDQHDGNEGEGQQREGEVNYMLGCH